MQHQDQKHQNKDNINKLNDLNVKHSSNNNFPNKCKTINDNLDINNNNKSNNSPLKIKDNKAVSKVNNDSSNVSNNNKINDDDNNNNNFMSVMSNQSISMNGVRRLEPTVVKFSHPAGIPLNRRIGMVAIALLRKELGEESGLKKLIES